MGYDYERNMFTDEQHSMLPIQVARLVFEMEPGDSGIVRDDKVWVDRSLKRAIWIDGNTESLTDNQVISIGNSDPAKFSRIHCVKKGLVLDRSHINQRTWDWSNGIYKRRDFGLSPEVFEMPIIYCAFNVEELELVSPALMQSGIKLRGLDSIPVLMEAIDDAEEIEDDDTQEEADEPIDEE